MLAVLHTPWFRVPALAVLVVTLQTVVVSQVHFLGASADLVVLFAVAGGLVGGPQRGTVNGFVFGIVYDLALTTPFGLWPLVLCVAGFVVGLTRNEAIRDNRWLQMGIVFVASGAVVVAYAAVATRVRVRGHPHAASDPHRARRGRGQRRPHPAGREGHALHPPRGRPPTVYVKGEGDLPLEIRPRTAARRSVTKPSCDGREAAVSARQNGRSMARDGRGLRLGVLGIVAVSLFATLFARLWYLQMMSPERLVEDVQTYAHPHRPAGAHAGPGLRPPRHGPGRQPAGAVGHHRPRGDPQRADPRAAVHPPVRPAADPGGGPRGPLRRRPVRPLPAAAAGRRRPRDRRHLPGRTPRGLPRRGGERGVAAGVPLRPAGQPHRGLHGRHPRGDGRAVHVQGVQAQRAGRQGRHRAAVRGPAPGQARARSSTRSTPATASCGRSAGGTRSRATTSCCRSTSRSSSTPSRPCSRACARPGPAARSTPSRGGCGGPAFEAPAGSVVVEDPATARSWPWPPTRRSTTGGSCEGITNKKIDGALPGGRQAGPVRQPGRVEPVPARLDVQAGVDGGRPAERHDHARLAVRRRGPLPDPRLRRRPVQVHLQERRPRPGQRHHLAGQRAHRVLGHLLLPHRRGAAAGPEPDAPERRPAVRLRGGQRHRPAG